MQELWSNEPQERIHVDDIAVVHVTKVELGKSRIGWVFTLTVLDCSEEGRKVLRFPQIQRGHVRLQRKGCPRWCAELEILETKGFDAPEELEHAQEPPESCRLFGVTNGKTLEFDICEHLRLASFWEQ